MVRVVEGDAGVVYGATGVVEIARVIAGSVGVVDNCLFLPDELVHVVAVLETVAVSVTPVMGING